MNAEVESSPRPIEGSRREAAKEDASEQHNKLIYKVDDVPPWYLCILLGLQQYLTMFSSAVTLPYLLSPALCIAENSPARAHLISAILFSSGIITLLQTTFGVRLPIVQGGTFSFLVPVFSLLSLPEYACPVRNNGTVNDLQQNMSFNTSNNSLVETFQSEDEIWKERMRVVQGSIIIASLSEIFLGLTGCIGALLRFITPLTIVPTITLVGLSFFEEASNLAGKNWPLSMGTVILLLLFSQYMHSFNVPIPKFVRGRGFSISRVPIFALLPVLLTIIIVWILCIMLTAFDVVASDSAVRTDRNAHILKNSPWIRFPYPGQWGMPTVSAAGVIGLLAGVVASIIESIGDYFACARLSGARPPPGHAINRGIMIEGIGCVIAGLYGTGVGTTSYSENIGAIGITKVASRRVIQFAGLVMIVMGLFTKFGALFVSIPTPIVGGIFLVMAGMITAVGLSNLQFVDLNSPRNMVTFGFSIFAGLSIPKWIARNKGVIDTGNELVNQVLFVLLSTNMLVGGILGCILDNTIPGSKQERGLLKWEALTQSSEFDEDSTSYDIPYVTRFLRNSKIARFFPICPTFDQRRPQNRENRNVESGQVNRTKTTGNDGKENYGFDMSSI